MVVQVWDPLAVKQKQSDWGLAELHLTASHRAASRRPACFSLLYFGHLSVFHPLRSYPSAIFKVAMLGLPLLVSAFACSWKLCDQSLCSRGKVGGNSWQDGRRSSKSGNSKLQTPSAPLNPTLQSAPSILAESAALWVLWIPQVRLVFDSEV